jgi:hypothetical protein
MLVSVHGEKDPLYIVDGNAHKQATMEISMEVLQ